MRALSHPSSWWLKAWGWSFLVFGLIALVVVGQVVWTVSIPVGQAWNMAARDWLPWALVSPLLFHLVSRLPIERSRWRLALPVHLLCGIAVVGIYTWWGEVVLPPPHPSHPTHAAEGETERPGIRPSHRPWMFAVLLFRVPIYLATVSVAHALYFYRRSSEREHSLNQAHLAALRMQLQPHFLFNSLNAIAALVHLDPAAADEMLVALSSLLRLSLETSGEQLLPLGRELEFVRRYLSIEHIRFGDRLCFTFEVAPDTQAALVPAFLLQPLVENSVRHGLEPRGGPGIVKVAAHRDGANLCLSVSDNGVGLPQGRPLREGIGLSNTRTRLSVLFDGAASLELCSGEGLTVHITLPFRTAA